MKTIWKFPLDLAPVTVVKMPVGAEVIHVAEQFGSVCLWAIVDGEAVAEPRQFTLVGTGHPIPPFAAYVGSVLLRGGEYVWHVFEG